MISRLSAALLIASAALSGTLIADTTARLSYSLEDQFGVTHTQSECGPVVTLLLGGDRKGVEFVGDWGRALHRAFARELSSGSVCSVGYAHLKGAPFFVRKKIVASFPKDPDAPTLLDWKGYIRKSWGGENDAANLYVFDREGRLALQLPLRAFDTEQFDRIVDAIASLLENEFPTSD